MILTALATKMANTSRLKISFKLCSLLLQLTSVTSFNSRAQDNYSFEDCNADLEEKFIQDQKCPHSGLFPVKGSCTAYIPCISFGGDLMKPLKRGECSSGMAFDVKYVRCRPAQTSGLCLQRHCYPTEATLENDSLTSLSSSLSPEYESHQMVSTSDANDDTDEISINVQQPPENGTNLNATDAVGVTELPVTSCALCAPIRFTISSLQKFVMYFTIIRFLISFINSVG